MIKKSAIDNVIESIKKGESFILEAGAGSGKTYTLIQSLNYILENYSEKLNILGQKISCITFTNVAKDEINKRTENNPLIEVQTIHEFLWSCIANFQTELHLKLNEINIEYERQRTQENRRATYQFIPDLLTLTNTKKIEYTDYGRNFGEGKLTHEDIILISYYMFRDYPVLSELISNKYPYIFIDEYQDTEEETVSVLLENILKANNQCLIGFFGDSMQKIYDEGIGQLPERYYDIESKDKCLNFITKEDNYRCSKAVITLLNKIRTNIQQSEGPNNKEGSISFFIGSDVESGLPLLEKNYGWNFNATNTKILFLTHTGIASKLGYEQLLRILNTRYGQFGRDRFFKKEELFSKFLIGEFGVEKLIENYEDEKFGEIIEQLKKVGFVIENHQSKEILKQRIDAINVIRNKGTVGEVFEFIKNNTLLFIPDKIVEFEKYITQEELAEDEKAEAKKQYYTSLMNLKYSEIISAYRFVEDKTIFSTKHGTKGAEFENVLVVLDGAWPQKYNFGEVFDRGSKNDERYKRSLNLLYVCCSRTINNLGILSLADMSKYKNAMVTITDWFGNDNIIKL